jgi:hypothetical protein
MELAARSVADRFRQVFLIRAAVCIVVAAVITFSADHTPGFGLVVFGAFSLVVAVVVLSTAATTTRTPSGRGIVLTQGAVWALGGVLALVAAVGGPGTASPALVPVLGSTSVAAGALELVVGLLRSERPAPHRDRIAAGAATVLLGLIVTVVPYDPVFVVGLFGAYAAILGVFLVIAALSVGSEAHQPSGPGKVSQS